ncbi:MAG: ParB N-terminal domain-containing protein, partial [Chloroflexota bacterium]
MTQTISNPVPAPANLGGEPGLVPVTNLVSNPWQPRRNFDINKLIELAEDIRLNGLLSPVVVRPVPGFPDMFEIAAGERRWRAFQLLVGGYELSGPATEGEDGGLVPGESEVDRVGPTYRAKPDPR